MYRYTEYRCAIIWDQWYGGGNSTSAEEVLQIPASLPES